MLRGELIALGAETRSADAQINALLAREPFAPLAAPLAVPVATQAPDFAALVPRLRDRSPELAVDAARQMSAERSRELAYRNHYPDFALAISPIQRPSSSCSNSILS